MGLPDGQKLFKIGLAVLIQYRRVTDTQPPSQPYTQYHTATQPRRRSIYRAYYVARVKIHQNSSAVFVVILLNRQTPGKTLVEVITYNNAMDILTF